MHPNYPPSHHPQRVASAGAELRGSARYRFCVGKCQDERPPEGGVEMSPGRWRCGACWIDISRKRQ